MIRDWFNKWHCFPYQNFYNSKKNLLNDINYFKVSFPTLLILNLRYIVLGIYAEDIKLTADSICWESYWPLADWGTPWFLLAGTSPRACPLTGHQGHNRWLTLFRASTSRHQEAPPEVKSLWCLWLILRFLEEKNVKYECCSIFK